MDNRHILMRILLLVICVLMLSATASQAASEKIDWNDRSIQWLEYDQGLDRAWREDKPMILVIYTDWCPACKKYGNTFRDRRVIAEAAKFVMVRVNKDRNKELSKQYGFDGLYIPRTIAIYPNGQVMHEIYGRKNHRYYIGTGAERLLKLMHDANKAL